MKTKSLTESFHSLAMKSLSLFLEPNNFKDAMTGPEAPLWKPVADDEIASHYKNDTWTLVPLPAGAICIPSCCDFKALIISIPLLLLCVLTHSTSLLPSLLDAT